MRNPQPNPQPSSSMHLTGAKLRASFARLAALARSLKPLRVFSMISFAGALLLASIFLHPNPVKHSAAKELTLSAAATSETSAQPAQPQAEPKQNAKRTGKKLVTKVVKGADKKTDSKSQSEPQKLPAPGARPAQELRLSPGAPPANEEGGQAENGDEIRERGNWFHDQRAYPFQHIPSGALQEAIRQRDAMKQRQRAQSQINPQAVITFPGDALWHLMGPQPVNELFSVNSGFPTASGRVTAIAVDPSDATGQTVYIGGAAGGVWKTTNGGTTWTVLTDTQPSLAVGCITIDPNNHNTIYVGTGEENFNGDAFYGAGVLKSTDGGTTWTQMGAIPFAQVLGPQTGGALIGQIAVQPGNSSIVLAAVSFFVGGTVGGIYRSTDGGSTWAEDASPQGVAATQVVFESTVNAGTTATAWAAMGNPFGEAANGIYKSTDSGATWTKQAGGLPTVNVGRIILGYAPSTSGAGATVYAAIANSSGSSANLLGFFKTTNGGTAWTTLGSTPTFCNSQCFYDMAIGVHPTNPLVVVVGGGAGPDNFSSLFETINGGSTWTGTGGDDFTGGPGSIHPHVDTHAIVFTPQSTTLRLYVGNDGGMWRTDSPVQGTVSPTWVDLNATLATIQFYPGPSAGIGDENFGFGGTQDNDTELFSGNLAWDNVFACGDGGFTAIDPNIPTSIYTTCDRGASSIIRKSVFNGSISTGQTFNPADSGIVRSDTAQFIPPLTIDQSNPNTLYFGTCRVYQTTDGANTWTPISGDLSAGNATPTTCPSPGTAGTITTMDVAHQNSSVVLAGTSNGKVWETTTGGISWNEIDTGLPARHVTAVRTKRNDATGMIAYVTLSGFGACAGCGGTPGHVFKTINGGTTWTNISGDLPDIPVNDLIVDHSSNPAFDALYIGTDVGVFSCPDPEAATPCTNWTVLGDGLPNSPVLGLAMRRSSRILRAATHGRSMWSIQLTDVSPPPLAALSSVTPGAVKVGAATLPVDIFGLNLSASTQVFFDGASVGAATFVDTTHLTVTVNSSFFTNGIVYQVSITDPAGADTSTLPFTVMNPILNAVSMTPPSTTVGTPVTLHFTGSNFVNGTSVILSSFPLLPLTGGVASAGGTVFDVPIPSFLLTAPAAITVNVTNPLPGGGPNPPFSFPFTINPDPNPHAVFIPSSITLGPIPVGTNTSTTNFSIQNVGGAALNITAATLTGTNAANFAFVAATSAPSCNFETSGIASVAAGTSCFFGIKFSANTPPGQANSVATLNVTDNSGGTAGTVQHISVTGLVGPVVFISPVNFGAVTVNTTSPTMNSTVLSFGGGATVTAVGISGANQADFKVVAAATGPGTNPDCGAVPFLLVANTPCDIGLQFTPSIVGNETATISLTDNAIASPQSALLTGVGVEVTSISPSIVPTGGPAFTLTVNGGGFAPSAVVNLNGSTRLTTFVSANQLQASIPASDIATAGNRAITVTTPVPGGTTSEPKTLVVAQATVSTNDNINFATSANTPPFRITEDTTQATVNTGGIADPTPPCAPGTATQGGKARSVWFTATPPTNGRVVFDTRFSSYPTILSAWTGTPGSLVSAGACASGNVPGAVPASQIVVNVPGGTKFFLMVSDASATGAGGTLTFSLDFQATAPANDDNATPTVIAAAPFTNSTNNIQATPNTNGHLDPALPAGCATGAASAGQANSIWYKFTAPSAGTITADTLTSPYDTILNATSGTPAGTQVACNNDATAGIAQSQVSFAATSATTYFFMVSSFLGDGGTTNFHLTFTPGGVGAPAKLAITTQPTNVAAGASITPAVQVTIQDAAGNTVTTATNSVTMAIGTNPSAGTLSGTTTVAAVNGVATFSNLSINNVGTGYTLAASATGLTGATSAAFNVTPGPPAKLAFSVQPTNVAAGASIAPAVQVTVQDAQGNTVTTATNSITMAIGTNPGGGTLSGTTTVAAVNGIASFANLSINKTGTGYTLAASATALTGSTSTAFNVTPGAATKLAFSVQPTNVGAGAAIAPAVQVTIQDAQGNTVTTAANSITMAIGTNPGGGTLSGTTSVAAVNGIATFSNLSINNTGVGYTLAASATGLTGATSAAFNVSAGAATKLAFTVQPTNVAAGASISPSVQVTVEDAGGNPITTATNSITIAIGTNPGGGTLSGTTTVAAVNGVATFSNLSINKTGTGYTLAASATGLTGSSSTAFNVTAGAAAKLAFSVQPSNVAAGASITPAVQVTVQDAQGNTVTTAANSITMAIGTNPSSGTLSGTTAVAAVNGVASFANLNINAAGTGYTLAASATGLTGTTSTAFNVTAGAAAKLAFSVQPTNVAAGASITPAVQVTVQDAQGNTVTTAVNSITMAIGTNPSGGTLSGTTTVAAVNGVASFANLSINKTGTGYTLAASATGLTGAASTAFNVTAGAAAKLAFSVQPTNVAAGASITPAVQVTVQDAQGNTVTTAANSITMAIGTNPSGGTLSGTTTVAAVNGVASFANLSVNKTGTGYTLAASAAGLTGATSTAFNVTAGAAAKLAFSVQPTNVAAGASITPAVQVTVQDAQGNTVTTAVNSITMAIGTNPSGGTLSGTTTVAAVNGVASFANLSINKTGTGYTLAASATGLTGATSTAFNVTAGAATKLAFSVQPTNVGAGSTITPAVQVTIQDAQGNTVTTAANSITMAIGTNPGAGTLSGTTSVAAVNGVATFSTLSINNAGTGYALAASATGLTGATSSAFNVTSGTAAKLAFTVQPTNVGAGSTITPSVQVSVQDAQGNTVTTATNLITIAIGTNPGGGTLSGTTAVAAVNGVATFSTLSINNTGTGYTLGATAAGLTSATSAAFNVTSGTASKLAFTVQPTNVGAGAAITPAVQVTIQDAQGNTVTSAATSITMAIGTNPGGGTLSGTTSVAAVNGVATFSNLSINSAGTGYTLAASATGLTGATSSAFNVTAGAATKLAFSVQPTNVVAGSSIVPAVQVTIQDAQGNTITTAANSITMAIGTNPSGGTLSGTTSVAAVNGVATFANLGINKTGNGYTLAASATGLTGATSTAFNVTAGAASKLAFTVQPTNVGAGGAITPAVLVAVQDASGNTITTATNSITMAIGTNPGGGTLSGTTTVAAVNGVATFSNLSINHAGTGYTLTATATGVTTATSVVFNVATAAASQLVFTVQPTSVGAGSAITPAVQVTVEDALGNTITTATNSITMAIGTNPAGGTLSGTTTVAAVNGVATFSNLSINAAGTGYTLSASATGLTSATSSAFNVTTGTAAKLAFTVQPTNVGAGSTIAPAVQVAIQDAQGNTVITAANSLTIAIGTNPAGGTLSGTTAVAAVNGVATFSTLNINSAGTGYTLTVSAAGLTSATSTAFNVTSGTAAKLAFKVQPSNVAAGASITPAVQVTIQDAQGNTVTTAANSVTMAIGTNPSAGTLSGTATVAAVNGVATFSNLSIDKLGTGYTLSATATALTSATSTAFNVTAGAATKLSFTVQPSNVAAGLSIAPAVQVTIEDAGGNIVTTATNSITMAIGTNPSGGTLSGTTSVAAVNGVATFANLSINKSGTGYTLAASATGLTGTTSSAFNVVAGAAAKLVFAVQPSNVLTGAAITPTVQVTVQDALGNTVISAVNPVTMAIGTNPSAGTLSGTTTIAAVNGIAAFSTLSINKAGTGYTLIATAAGLTSATSASFNVNNPVPTVASLVPANVNAGSGILLLTINGTNFATGATVTFGSDPAALVPVTNTGTVITVNIPAADLAAGGMFPVVVTNPGPGGGPSAVTANSTFIVNNPVPTVSKAAAAGLTHISGGAAFTLTLTGTNFVSTSTVNFNGAAVTTHFGTATQLTADIPAGAVAKAGNVNVTVTNPAPAGGTSAPPFVFTVDGFTAAGPANTNVADGKVAMIEIDVTPTVNGFTNPVTFSVTGLPKNTSFVFMPTSVTPGAAVGKTILQITTKASSGVPPSSPFERPPSPLLRLLPLVWIAALLAGIYAMFLLRRTPLQLRRYAAIVPLALLLLTGAVLAGCAGQFTGTPKGAAPLVVTATSGTMSQTDNVTLTVQ